MLDSPFMDQVNRATYDQMVPRGHADAGHRAILGRIRQSLRSASRFSLDDDTVRLICEMTREHKKLELWSILARLPFDRVWIEFDLHVKVGTFAEMGTLVQKFDPTEVSYAAGYLLEKDLDSKTRWTAQEFVSEERRHRKEEVFTQPCMLVFDPNGSSIQPCRGSTRWRQPTLSQRPNFPRHPVVIRDGSGSSYELKDTFVDPEFTMVGLIEPKSIENGETRLMAPDWVANKVAVVPDPIWAQWVEGPKLDSIMAIDVRERSSVLKWLIVALAMINDAPKTVKHIARTGSQFTRGGPIKYLDHHIVTINVPKGTQRRSVSRILDKASVHASRAWHTVRGHWAVVEYGKAFAGVCKHLPTEVDGDYALCTRCERLIKWKEFPHGRGDPRLGIISHDYEVEARP